MQQSILKSQAPMVDSTLFQTRSKAKIIEDTINRMNFSPCIQSLLETDLYKLTMMQMFQHLRPDAMGEYRFLCRNPDVTFTQAMLDEINLQLDYVSFLNFSDEEIAYLHQIRFLKYDFVESLRYFHMNRDHIVASLDDNGKLDIRVNGLIYQTTLWEIYTLAIVNEVYFRFTYADEWDSVMDDANDRLTAKIANFVNKVWLWRFTDFGLRRRLCREWHMKMVARLLNEAIILDSNTGETVSAIAGTSDVFIAFLAYKFGYPLIAAGTCGHESIQLYQGFEGIDPAYSNHFMLDDWYKEYHGDLGIALTDTISTDVFLMDIRDAEAKMLSGYRNDSGDPIRWGNAIISRLESFGVNPKDKLLLFSNGLDGEEANRINQYFAIERGQKVGFGIGTWFTNDTGRTPLNIVMKLQKVNGQNVIKLSDDVGKTMSLDKGDTEYLRRSVVWRLLKKKPDFNPDNCLASWIKPWMDNHPELVAIYSGN